MSSASDGSIGGVDLVSGALRDDEGACRSLREIRRVAASSASPPVAISTQMRTIVLEPTSLAPALRLNASLSFGSKGGGGRRGEIPGGMCGGKSGGMNGGVNGGENGGENGGGVCGVGGTPGDRGGNNGGDVGGSSGGLGGVEGSHGAAGGEAGGQGIAGGGSEGGWLQSVACCINHVLCRSLGTSNGRSRLLSTSSRHATKKWRVCVFSTMAMQAEELCKHSRTAGRIEMWGLGSSLATKGFGWCRGRSPPMQTC